MYLYIHVYIYTHICYMHTLSHGKCLIYMLTRSSHGQLLVTSWTCSPPSSSVYDIFLARILEWVAMPSSKGSSQPGDQTCFSCLSCIATNSLLLSYSGSSNPYHTAFNFLQQNILHFCFSLYPECSFSVLSLH